MNCEAKFCRFTLPAFASSERLTGFCWDSGAAIFEGRWCLWSGRREEDVHLGTAIGAEESK